ncbi:MAG TPA: phosphotransferase, partial [Pseudonocardiaceae bacterium]|nr:phosphotransferase [Pseudonocardiaceae bacterium]
MTNILGVGGNRLVWTDLPEHVRSGVEEILGAPVDEAVSEPGGFSPGLASRVVLADGRRMFVKAVSSARNIDSVRMYAAEARILAGLHGVEWRSPVAVPRLLGRFEDGDWIALVISEVAGRQPAVPWQEPELDRIVDAVQVLGECLTPNPLAVPVPPVTESCADVMSGWRTMAGGSPDPGVPAWAAANLDRLAELESGWSAAATGDTLLHLDLRADNLLLTDDRVYV